MAKVFDFPKKKELPEEYEERLYEVAKAYVTVVKEACEYLCEDPWDDEEMFEINELVLNAYVEGLETAIDDLE